MAVSIATVVVDVLSPRACVTVGAGYVPPRSPLAAPVGAELGVCQMAVVLDVAVRT